MQKTIQYWTDGAQRAQEIMEALIEKEKFPEALFFGHLVLEKILKALVTSITKEHAPHSHNLSKLALLANRELSEDDALFLEKATEFNLEGRYPEDVERLRKEYTKDFAIDTQKRIHKLYQLWLQEIQQ